MLVAEIAVPCIWGAECHLDWAALAALGGWAAALATFFAVLLPYWRERRRFKLRARLSLGTYASSLDHLARRLNSLSTIRAALASGTYAMEKDQLNVFFGLELDFPVFEIEPELEQVIQASHLLRAEISTWQQAVQAFLFVPEDPVSPKRIGNMAPVLDALTDRLHDSIHKVIDAIGQVEPSLRRNEPSHARGSQ